jgi:subtilisin family serine protease
MDARRQRTIFILFGLLFVLGLGLFAVARLSPSASLAPSGNTGAGPVLPALPTPPKEIDPKLASVLGQLLEVYVRDGSEAARDFSRRNFLTDEHDVVHVTLELDTEDPAVQQEIVEQLERRGVEIEAIHSRSLSISFTVEQAAATLDFPTPGPGTPFVLPTAINASSIPKNLLEELAALKHVTLVRLPNTTIPPDTSFSNPPAFAEPTNEAITVIKADAWHQKGITGKGVKVGILDMGYLSYQEMLGVSLPQNVHVKSFGRIENMVLTTRWDLSHQAHGTACAEVIHALAPDAELYLAAFDAEPESFKEAIDWFLSEDVHIISASLNWFDRPTDGTSDLDQIVDNARARGALYVAAAGNMRAAHYKDTYKAGKNGYTTFRTGGQTLGFNAYVDGTVWIELRWDDWAQRKVDYNLYLYDSTGKKVVSSSTNKQNGATFPPTERLAIELDAGQYYLAIQAPANSPALRYDLHVLGGIRLAESDAGESLVTPSDAKGALAVGAVNWRDDVLESYSSSGPTADGRFKPEISAPTDVSSAVFRKLGVTYTFFNGTSAATPHVAGAAALVLSAFPQMTADQLQQYLLDHARDLDPPGQDFDFGYGRLELGLPPTDATPTGTPIPPTAVPATEPPTEVIVPPTEIPATTVPSTPIPQTAEPPAETPTQPQATLTTEPPTPTIASIPPRVTATPTASSVPPPPPSGPSTTDWMAAAGVGLAAGSLLGTLCLWIFVRIQARRQPAMTLPPFPLRPQAPPNQYPPPSVPPGYPPPQTGQGGQPPGQLPNQPSGGGLYPQYPPGAHQPPPRPPSATPPGQGPPIVPPGGNAPQVRPSIPGVPPPPPPRITRQPGGTQTTCPNCGHALNPQTRACDNCHWRAP